MIISASYKTDIPAFYGEWFIRRLEKGYCRTINPYNRRVSRVDLSRESVDGIVFWTRNPLPFMEGLELVRQKGYPFYVQFTITGYPSLMERHVPPLEEALSLFRRISGRFGPHAVVWRYDPILFSSVTDAGFHLRNFSSIAHDLRGFTSEVVVSFARFYRKSRRNMEEMAAEAGFSFSDPSDEEKKGFARRLSAIAGSENMTLSLCGQRELLAEGVKDASCIDPYRLSMVAGTPLPVPPKRSHRPGSGCGCYASRDVGEYETCLHGCRYCYAVENIKRAIANFRRHDPSGEFLLPPFPEGNDGDGICGGTQGHLF